MGETVRVAAVQLSSQSQIDANLEMAALWIRRAHGAGAQLIATPEMTSLVQSDCGALLASLHPEASDPAVAFFADLARTLSVWLLIGSLPILSPSGSGKARNRSFLFGPDGGIVARYDKIHLFDVDLPDGNSIRESETYEAGEERVLAPLPWCQMGMSICFDVRFPALYRHLAVCGAVIQSVPAAFTAVTGAAHWEVLLRARAIETGSFVVAPAQSGVHDCGRTTHGHTLIVGPWGEILGECTGEGPGVVVADLDLGQAALVRRQIPVLDDRQ